MNRSPKEYYLTENKAIENELIKIKQTISHLFFGRLTTFIAIIVFLVLYVQQRENALFLLGLIFSTILFSIAVRIDQKKVSREKYLLHRKKVIEIELGFLNHEFQNNDSGTEFERNNLHLSVDFNLFGPKSLFQYLNRTSTYIGRRKLAQRISAPNKNIDQIKEQQKSIKELSGKSSFAINFRTLGLYIHEKGNEIEDIEAWISQNNRSTTTMQILRFLIPVFNLSCFALAIFGFIPPSLIVIPIVLSLTIVALYTRKINIAHSKVGKKAQALKLYSSLLKEIENGEFQSSLLIKSQALLISDKNRSSVSLTALFKLLNAFDIRYNFILSIILNSIFLFDLHVYCKLIRWKKAHKNIIPQWFECLAEYDAQISLATFTFNNQNLVCFPTLVDSESFLYCAIEMGHPLLPHNERVCNDFGINNNPNISIITGANMAGKSTFLRTLATNFILGMTGAPVCAKSFEFTPCDIKSSIKIEDSLSKNESYFYAELLRIKEILEHVKANPKTLVILDEILRGTNTKDKQLGSIGLIKQLISLNAVVLIATHDLSMGEMEHDYPEIVHNFCFEVELNNNDLIFDYKIKPGISKKLNASFLMKKMGIIS
ncbi:MAG: hypothetical protein PHW19_06035 [Salinivirgaceae bacterium]|nr:hypothetical protein [Salinivirgaceae bacterium]